MTGKKVSTAPTKPEEPGTLSPNITTMSSVGHYSTTRISRGDGDHALTQNAWNAQWSHNRYRAYYPWTMGGAIWSMYDYNQGCCDNICYSGLADLFRLPKFGMAYFRTQVPAGSYTPAGKMPYEVFINSHWMPDASDTPAGIRQCRRSGTAAQRQVPCTPQTGQWPFNLRICFPSRRRKCRHINYPPFTFLRSEMGKR